MERSLIDLVSESLFTSSDICFSVTSGLGYLQGSKLGQLNSMDNFTYRPWKVSFFVMIWRS